MAFGTLAPAAERQFRLLWFGRLASSVGDVLVPVALAFAVLGLRDSALAFGLVLAAFTATRVAGSLVGGVVADRFSRRTVLLSCDLSRAAIEAFTAAMLFSHHMTVPLFVVTAALFGAASAFFGPAATALVPQTTSPENLQAANALLGMSQNLLNVFGPAVSGALIVALHTTAWVFAIDAVSFIVSAFFISRLQVRPVEGIEHTRFTLELRRGFAEVRSRGWVSSALIGFSISNVCLASFLVLGPFVVRHHGGAGDWGIVAACGAIGAAGGYYLSARIRPEHPLAAGFSVSVLIALPIAALAGPLPVPVIAVAFALGMAAISFCNNLWETTLQRRIPGMVLARVRSYDQLVSFVFMPIGYVAFGALAEGVGSDTTLLVTAGVVALTNAAVASIPCIRALTADEPALAAALTPA